MTAAFEAVVPVLEKDGALVHLIRIIGPRSSFVAGRIPAEMPFVAPHRVVLDQEWALLIYAPEGHLIDEEGIREAFMGSML